MKTKLKTKGSAKRRFKVTKNGKVLAYHAGSTHFKRRKRANRRRRLRQKQTLFPGDARRVKKMMPYG